MSSNNFTYLFTFYESIDNKKDIFFSNNSNYKISIAEILKSNTFFNSNSYINLTLLNDIYEFSQNTYHVDFISKKIWINFLLSSNIYSKLYSFSNTIYKQNTHSKLKKSYTVSYGGKNHTLSLKKYSSKKYADPNYSSKPLFKIPRELTEFDKSSSVYIEKNFYKFDNSQHSRIFSLLEAIFSLNKQFYIRKCKLCNTFFLAARSNTVYCPKLHKRKITDNEATVDEATVNEATVNEATVDEATVDGATVNEATVNEATINEATVDKATVDGATDIYLTCSELVAHDKKTHKYKQFQKLSKNFLATLRNNKNITEETINKYKIAQKEKIKECILKNKLDNLSQFISSYKEDLKNNL